MRSARPARAAAEVSDVLRHLGDSLDSQWRRYRKRLKRCQTRFSEKAVHESRVETRRLQATIELLGAFIPEKQIERARAELKNHLDTFDQLRDTHVQLVYVGHLVDSFAAARPFRDWLGKREKKFTTRADKDVKDIRTRRLARSIAGFDREIRRLRKHTTPDKAFETSQLAINRAFARVAQLCRRVKADDSDTIHRTRIAFKRFRYMVDAMSPLLPAVTEEHRRAMRGYQSMMGDIQDVEVLLGAFAKFLRKKEVNTAAAKKLRDELRRRRQWLIRVYLGAADRLRQFWPPGQPAVQLPKPPPTPVL